MNKFEFEQAGIYIIKNTKNGKAYIGSSVSLRVRVNIHKRELRNNRHHSSKLQRAWNKHGELSFIFELLELVADKETLLSREQHWIDLLDTHKKGYNCCPIAGSALGREVSEETRRKSSESNKGNIRSAEARKNMSIAVNKRIKDGTYKPPTTKGKTFSLETRLKMSEARKGTVDSEETRKRKSEGIKLRPPISDETREKMSESSKNRPQETKDKFIYSRIGSTASPETRAKMSKSHQNYSDEYRAKISEALTGRVVSQETRDKIGAANKERWRIRNLIYKQSA
jgi:group I intron endonuclease